MNRYKRTTAAMLVAALLVTLPMRAFASATVSSYTLTCTSLTATGSTTAPFLQVYVHDQNTGQVLVWDTQPASGSFTVLRSFAAERGHLFDIEMWGSSTTILGDWDDQPYFQTYTTCADPVPASSPLTLALTALLLAGSIALVNTRRRGSGLRR